VNIFDALTITETGELYVKFREGLAAPIIEFMREDVEAWRSPHHAGRHGSRTELSFSRHVPLDVRRSKISSVKRCEKRSSEAPGGRGAKLQAHRQEEEGELHSKLLYRARQKR
jgi:hypothetical protein